MRWPCSTRSMDWTGHRWPTRCRRRAAGVRVGNRPGARRVVCGRLCRLGADAADPASQGAGVEQAAAALGAIDILVHNAGVAEFSAIADDTDETYDRQFGVNVKGLHVGTRAALPHLSDGGRIILIGSVSGELAFPATAVYSATKAAVAALARGWAKDLAQRNILVNTVQPGPIDTDMNPADSEFAQQMTGFVPLGRYGRVEEISGAVSFLAGPDASYITGTTLNVDGGAAA